MATAMNFFVNIVDDTVPYVTTPADYGLVDLSLDYLIWSGSLANHMTHQPTQSELNAAAAIIDPLNVVTVAECLWMNYSHDVQGPYYTLLVQGMGANAAYVFLFSFDGATATEPQLEAWDTSAHATSLLNTLGAGTPANSFVKAVCTTGGTLPGSNWVGTAIAGASNVVLLNNGSGALVAPGSGLTNDLYANIKIKIPANYATPSAEQFVLTVRYTFF